MLVAGSNMKMKAYTAASSTMPRLAVDMNAPVGGLVCQSCLLDGN